ncbi:hypothetical protein K432DRAFT_378445 [Lepidopterella palustris CBS 459.81]|uniref:Uncharacterized protein n=1 Tax=Lepidopterella palustris CBS 459.81 TaxID=1314670 RepID=A0A8E2EIH6_9PEZI|nr:hypothetical protein K432DRAFT_378445 [Lepidopterella palustris CBS 459.81]
MPSSLMRSSQHQLSAPRKKKSSKTVASKKSHRTMYKTFEGGYSSSDGPQHHRQTPVPCGKTEVPHTHQKTKEQQDPVMCEKNFQFSQAITPSTGRIIHQRSHSDVWRPDDRWYDDPFETPLENTMRVVHKASTWFRKLTGGRKSAPPHEKAASRGYREWK